MSRARRLLVTALWAGMAALSVQSAETVLAAEQGLMAEPSLATEPGLVAEPLTRAGTAAAGNTPPILPTPQVDPVSESFAVLRKELADARLHHAALEDSNARLTELNAQLRQEIESLAIELQTAREQGERRALLYGAGLILAGMIVGALLRRRPRNSVWN